MDADGCHGYQAVSEYAHPEPMARAFPPSGSWEDCRADILGPLHSGESLLVVVDILSRYFEVVILRSTSSTRIVEGLKPIFARFGVLHTLKIDNGPQLVSEEFEIFLAENGIEHRTTPPLWPQANGEVERQNRTFLTAYRSTPQIITGATPLYLMFGREMRSKLPDLRKEAPITNEEVRDRDWSRMLSQREYVGAKRSAVASEVEIGDKELLRNSKTNKRSPNYNPNSCKAVDRKGGEVTVRSTAGAEIVEVVLVMFMFSLKINIKGCSVLYQKADIPEVSEKGSVL